MSFLKENGAAVVLIAAIFMSLGFMLGRCCSHHGCCPPKKGCHKTECHKKSDCSKSCSSKCSHGEGHGHHEEMVFVEALIEDGFEGDTTISIEGGEVIVKVIDGEVDVDFDLESLEEILEGAHGDNIHEVHKEVRIFTTEEH